MASLYPYTYISCPCSNSIGKIVHSKRASREIELEDENEEEEKTFDPRHPRSNFSLFPPEHLLYCEECHDIKCPRCVTEEIICWYCPSCLFEVPSSTVRADNNRCSRNCFSCPMCTSQLITASIGDRNTGPYILNCNYCMWSTLDIGIKFETHSNLRGAMDARVNEGIKPGVDKTSESNQRLRDILGMKSGYQARPKPSREFSSAEDITTQSDVESIPKPKTAATPTPNMQFAALISFYKEQLASTATIGSAASMLENFASPSALSRMMNLYSTGGAKALKATKPPSNSMREAINSSEGLVAAKETDEELQIATDFLDSVSLEQQTFQYPRSNGAPDARRVNQLWPMSTLLRTKRSKRCAECKHILVKPEFKVTSTRYRIRLTALNYIPMISLKPVPISGGLKPPGPDGADVVLEPGKASQWIMKLTNPLFENVSVSLGSPSVTPGKHGHKVTILCPQFSIGKNGDVWDDALNANVSKAVTAPAGGEQIAGKLYESGRNWASVVVEVIPSHILKGRNAELEEDEDVIEVPIRVRLEWTVPDEDGDKLKKKSDKALDEHVEVDDGKRELAYWMVIGIGRVAV